MVVITKVEVMLSSQISIFKACLYCDWLEGTVHLSSPLILWTHLYCFHVTTSCASVERTALHFKGTKTPLPDRWGCWSRKKIYIYFATTHQWWIQACQYLDSHFCTYNCTCHHKSCIGQCQAWKCVHNAIYNSEQGWPMPNIQKGEHCHMWKREFAHVIRDLDMHSLFWSDIITWNRKSQVSKRKPCDRRSRDLTNGLWTSRK